MWVCLSGSAGSAELVMEAMWETGDFEVKQVVGELEKSHASLIVSGGSAAGSHKTNVLPRPGVLSTSMRPC
jgi:hypothetical protein